MLNHKRQRFASFTLKRQSFPDPQRQPEQGRRRSPGRGRRPSACSETHTQAESVKQQRGGEVLSRRSRSASHRQVVDSFRKRSNLPHGALGILHLQTRHTHAKSEPHKSSTEVRCEGAEEATYLLQALQLLLTDLHPGSLEAGALGHLHVHGADKLLAVVHALLPQRAETTKGQTSRLSFKKRKNSDQFLTEGQNKNSKQRTAARHKRRALFKDQQVADNSEELFPGRLLWFFRAAWNSRFMLSHLPPLYP